MTAATTRSGRPKLPPTDTEAIRAEVKAEVQAVLNKHKKNEAEQLRAVVALAKPAEATLAEYGDFATALALSLALYEGARGMSNVIGLSRERFYKLTVDALGEDWKRPSSWGPEIVERARKRKVPFYSDAADMLPDIAQRVVHAKVMIEESRKVRDELMARLYREKKMTRLEIADILERNPSRVSQVVYGTTRGKAKDEGETKPKGKKKKQS